MPQRRAYNPTTMSAPTTGNTGSARQPPGLQQGAQPVPPGPLSSDPNLTPPPAGQPSQGSPSQDMGMSKPPLPASIPLATPPSMMGQGGNGAGASAGGAGQPPGAGPGATRAPFTAGGGTLNPLDVGPFLQAKEQPGGASGMPGDMSGMSGMQDPSMLLKLLSSLGMA